MESQRITRVTRVHPEGNMNHTSSPPIQQLLSCLTKWWNGDVKWWERQQEVGVAFSSNWADLWLVVRTLRRRWSLVQRFSYTAAVNLVQQKQHKHHRSILSWSDLSTSTFLSFSFCSILSLSSLHFSPYFFPLSLSFVLPSSRHIFLFFFLPLLPLCHVFPFLQTFPPFTLIHPHLRLLTWFLSSFIESHRNES